MTRPGLLAAGLALALVATSVLASEGVDFGTTKIEPLSSADELKSESQRRLIDGLARRRLGSGFGSGPEADLRLLQRLFDERVVAREQLYELQAMGVVLGDVMAKQLRLRWVSIDDDIGHSRALRYRETEHLFFPVTMLSKRAKLGDPVKVQALYDKTADQVAVLERRSR